MQPAYDLSFCIPTYNFAAFIGETLDSIIQQADDRVQIVIVDGGSTDNTAQIVAEKARSFPNIKFIQRTQRCGVDLDILESVAQADGEFCWLFSSDDLALDPYHYVAEPNEDTEPGRTNIPGVFVAGAASGAKDITDSILHAGAAAAQVAAHLESLKVPA